MNDCKHERTWMVRRWVDHRRYDFAHACRDCAAVRCDSGHELGEWQTWEDEVASHGRGAILWWELLPPHPVAMRPPDEALRAEAEKLRAEAASVEDFRAYCAEALGFDTPGNVPATTQWLLARFVKERMAWEAERARLMAALQVHGADLSARAMPKIDAGETTRAAWASICRAVEIAAARVDRVDDDGEWTTVTIQVDRERWRQLDEDLQAHERDVAAEAASIYSDAPGLADWGELDEPSEGDVAEAACSWAAAHARSLAAGADEALEDRLSTMVATDRGAVRRRPLPRRRE